MHVKRVQTVPDVTGCKRNYLRPKHEFSHNLQGATPEQMARDRTSELPAGAQGSHRVLVQALLGPGPQKVWVGGERTCGFPYRGNRGYRWFHMPRLRAGWKCPEIKSEQDMISGVKAQSDLGFSWGCGKLLSTGTVQRPGQGSRRAGFRRGLISEHAPFLKGSRPSSVVPGDHWRQPKDAAASLSSGHPGRSSHISDPDRLEPALSPPVRHGRPPRHGELLVPLWPCSKHPFLGYSMRHILPSRVFLTR